MKNYLDDRLRTAICDYKKATEPDLYKVKASKLQAEDHIVEIKDLAIRVQKSKIKFMMPQNDRISSEEDVFDINDVSKSAVALMLNTKIKGLVEAVQDAGRLLRDFDDAVARLANDS